MPTYDMYKINKYYLRTVKWSTLVDSKCSTPFAHKKKAKLKSNKEII